MSNIEKERLKRKRLGEKNRLNRKRELQEKAQEIEALKQEIKDKKRDNFKTGGIRNLKVAAKALEIVRPYALAAGLVVGTFALCKATPFYRDNVKAHLVTLTEYNEKGDSKTSQKYESTKYVSKTEDKSSKIVCCTKWQQNSNGSYSRDKEIYSLDGKTFDDISELIGKNEQEIRQILNEKFSFITKSEEISKELTEEDLKKDFTFMAMMYSEDKNNYIVRKEETGRNLVSTYFCICILLASESIVLYLKNGLEGESFYDVIYVKNQYKKINLTELKEKLKVKELEYKNLDKSFIR